jgi:hypothetical protein
MGIRGEIFSTTLQLKNRTYFFNVKENRMGDLYLNIVESKNKETGGFERQSVVLFADDLQQFLQSFDDSLRFLEKAVRDKKKAGGGPAHSERPRKPLERGTGGVAKSPEKHGTRTDRNDGGRRSSGAHLPREKRIGTHGGKRDEKRTRQNDDEKAPVPRSERPARTGRKLMVKRRD